MNVVKKHDLGVIALPVKAQTVSILQDDDEEEARRAPYETSLGWNHHRLF